MSVLLTFSFYINAVEQNNMQDKDKKEREVINAIEWVIAPGVELIEYNIDRKFITLKIKYKNKESVLKYVMAIEHHDAFGKPEVVGYSEKEGSDYMLLRIYIFWDKL